MHINKNFTVEFTDIKKISEICDKSSLEKLIQMVIGAILNKGVQEFISKLMVLDEDIQIKLMPFIQDIMNTPELTDDVQQLKRSMIKQLDENERLNELFQDKILECENLTSEMSHLQDYIRELEGKPQSINRIPSFLSVSSMEMQLAKKESELERVNEDYENLRQKYITEVESLQNFVDEHKDMSVDYKKLKKEVETLRKNNEKLSKFKLDYEKLSQTHSNYVDRLKVYEKEAFTINQEIQNVGNLKQIIEDLKITIQTKDFKIDEQKKEIMNLCKSKQEAESSRDFYMKELKTAKDELSLRRQPTSSLANELSSLDDDLRVDYEQEQEKMKKLLFTGGIITGLQNQIDSIIKEKVQISAELQNMTITKNTLDSELINLNNILQETTRASTQKIEKLKTKKKNLKFSYNETKSELALIQNNLSEQNKRVSELSNLQDDLKNFYKEKQKLYEKLAIANKEKQEILSKLNLKEMEFQKLNIDFDEINRKYLETKKSLEISQENIEKFLNTSNESEVKQRETYYKDEIAKLGRLLKDKEQELEKLISEKQIAEGVSDRAKVDVENYIKEKDSMTEIIEKESKKVKQLEKLQEDLNNSWKTEMKLVSMIVHEVGLEYLNASYQLHREKKKLRLIT